MVDGVPRLEIIDGLQRLNAVFSFIENEYSLDDGYFDSDTLAETKDLVDSGALRRGDGSLDRPICIALASYTLTISVYRTTSEDAVEEVFRRINSNGRHLSRQEIRQAGCTSNFADLVHTVAASVRGDYSVSENVDLKAMPQISISSSEDGSGVFVDRIFWVRHHILGRDQVRESRDEEIVADLLASMLVEPLPPYDSRVLDEFYGLGAGDGARKDKIELAIIRDTPEQIKARFDRTLAVFEELFATDAGNFSTILFDSPRQRVPRYFEAVFLALDILMSEEHRDLDDVPKARASLSGFGSNYMNIPGGGGTWTASSKRTNAEVIAGIIRSSTRTLSGPVDPTLERNALQAQRLLRASYVETAVLELKQGFSELSEPPILSSRTIEEIARTISAMANNGPDTIAYILVGAADKVSDARRVGHLSASIVPTAEGRFITGVDLDIAQRGNLDNLLLWVTDKLRSAGLESHLESQVLRDMRATQVAGRSVVLFKVLDIGRPVALKDEFYVRLNSETIRLTTERLGQVFSRF